jgi:hypothetical protein
MGKNVNEFSTCVAVDRRLLVTRVMPGDGKVGGKRCGCG